MFSAFFWAGWDDAKLNGHFVDVNTGEVITKDNGYWPFFAGEPNGGDLENCAVVWPARKAWNDAICTVKSFGFCRMQARPRFFMRGN